VRVAWVLGTAVLRSRQGPSRSDEPSNLAAGARNPRLRSVRRRPAARSTGSAQDCNPDARHARLRAATRPWRNQPTRVHSTSARSPRSLNLAGSTATLPAIPGVVLNSSARTHPLGGSAGGMPRKHPKPAGGKLPSAHTLLQRDGRIYRAKKIFKKVGLLVGRFLNRRSLPNICGVCVRDHSHGTKLKLERRQLAGACREGAVVCLSLPLQRKLKFAVTSNPPAAKGYASLRSNRMAPSSLAMMISPLRRTSTLTTSRRLPPNGRTSRRDAHEGQSSLLATGPRSVRCHALLRPPTRPQDQDTREARNGCVFAGLRRNANTALGGDRLDLHNVPKFSEAFNQALFLLVG
jgi:hypothetical protein